MQVEKKDTRVAPSPSPTTYEALAKTALPNVYTTLENGSMFLRYDFPIN
jgi:hypothetical protein